MKFRKVPLSPHTIDFCCTIDNIHIVTGWSTSNSIINSDFSIIDSEGSSVDDIKIFKGDRPDVINSLNLQTDTLEIGFAIVFSSEITTNNKVYSLKTNDSSIQLDLTNSCKIDALQKHIVNFNKRQQTEIINHLKTVLHQDAFINTINHSYSIDYAGYYGEYCVIGGWCLFEDIKKRKIELYENENKPIKNVVSFFGDRNDVIKQLNYSNKNKDFGFLVFFKFTETSNNITLKLIDKNISSTIDVNLHSNINHDAFNATLKEFSPLQRDKVIDFLSGIDFSELFNKLYTKTTENDIALKYGIDHYIILNSGIFINGWMVYSDNIDGIYFKSKNKISKNIYNNIFRNQRNDVNTVFTDIPSNHMAGFYFYLDTSEFKSNTDAKLCITLSDKTYLEIDLSNHIKSCNEIGATKIILDNVNINGDLSLAFNNDIYAALNDAWSKKKNIDSKNVLCKSFGEIVPNPLCSIIVPIYGRYDFVMYQLSQFANDNDFNSIELIYVLDDPKLENIFFDYCYNQHNIFNVPFKVVYNYQNNGFGGANNLGAAFATSDKILLLNSDVMPSETGWVKKLTNIYNSLDNPGLLGCKLLYDDESIQHLGMDFKLNDKFNIYLNRHPGKGLHENLLKKFNTKIVPAVTAACALIDKKIYSSVNGFDLNYIIGDFEDSDLSLRLVSMGYNNYVTSLVTLYHLERQSQNTVEQGDWKHKLTLYNGLTQHKKWSELIINLTKKTDYVEG